LHRGFVNIDLTRKLERSPEASVLKHLKSGPLIPSRAKSPATFQLMQIEFTLIMVGLVGVIGSAQERSPPGCGNIDLLRKPASLRAALV
jgi:hypothetical protein